MGINDLLKLYKPIIQQINISSLKGKCAGIDMMVWLYRGVYAAINNCTDEDFSKSDLYLNFPLKMLLLLKEKGIKCIAVFDGHNNIAKFTELKNRVEMKETNRQLALSLAKEGKEDESKKIMKRTLKIKSRMINTLITLLKQMEIKVIVAPYEADSQLAYLYKHKYIDFAISEDSDLIPYGIQHIAFKLDTFGNMSYFDLTQGKMKQRHIINEEGCNLLLSMTHYNLVSFCVMLGCDYLPSIKGFGAKSGIKLFKNVKNITEAIDYMKSSGKYNIDEDYLHKAQKAISVFYLQTVFDPNTNQLVSLNDINYNRDIDTVEDLIIKAEMSELYLNDKNYYGSFFEKYEEYCLGDVDIKTKSKEKKIENKEVIEKYYRRFGNLLKMEYNVETKPFKKKVDYITINNTNISNDDFNKQLDKIAYDEIEKDGIIAEEEVEVKIENEYELDISKEIEYLKNEMNNPTNTMTDYNYNFLGYKRLNDTEIKLLNEIDEEVLLTSLEKIIQNEEKILKEKNNPVLQSQNNNSFNSIKTPIKDNNKQWNISKNAEIKPSKGVSIINDIKINH